MSLKSTTHVLSMIRSATPAVPPVTIIGIRLIKEEFRNQGDGRT